MLARLRYALESIGPELRQYIVTSNDEERPFSRDQRRWVYTSAKGLNNYVGFGTDNDIEHDHYPVLRQRTFAAHAPPTPTSPPTTRPRCRAPRCWAAPADAGWRFAPRPS